MGRGVRARRCIAVGGYRRPGPGLHRGSGAQHHSSFSSPILFPPPPCKGSFRPCSDATQRRSWATDASHPQHCLSANGFFCTLFFLPSSLLPFPVGQQQQKMLRSKTSSAAWPCPLALPACLLEGAISVASPAICCSVLTASVPSVEPSCRSCPRLRSWSPSSAEGSSDGRQFLPDP